MWPYFVFNDRIGTSANYLGRSFETTTLAARKEKASLGGRPGLVVMGDDSCLKVVGLNTRILYGHLDIFSHLFVAKII